MDFDSSIFSWLAGFAVVVDMVFGRAGCCFDLELVVINRPKKKKSNFSSVLFKKWPQWPICAKLQEDCEYHGIID